MGAQPVCVDHGVSAGAAMTEPFTILLIAGVFLLAFTITEPTERKP